MRRVMMIVTALVLMLPAMAMGMRAGSADMAPASAPVQQTAEGSGELQLPPYFADGMVLPRNRAFALKGMANAGERIRVTWTDEKRGRVMLKLKAMAARDGRWCVRVPALKEGITYGLKVTGKGRSIDVHGILAGELWLASGQSNMAFQLQQGTTAAEDIAGAGRPAIRLLNLRPRWETDATVWSPEALDSVNRLLYYHDATWQVCSPQVVRNFSAVAYHFACTLQDSLQCPIGIICNAVGGSGEEAWIDRQTMERGFPEMLREWTANEYIQEWVRGRAQLNMGWQQAGAVRNPGQRHPYEPCYLYDSSISLLRDMPIGGVIWYQGESNAQDMETHARLFPLLLKSWRETWENDSMPFIYTQLSSLNRPTWPQFRDLQRQQLYRGDGGQMDATLGMAVTSDVGDSLDVHPRNKRPVGNRLARWALHNVYGHDCVCSGPLFRSSEMSEGGVVICFDFSQGLHTSDGREVRTLEVSADDVHWRMAAARIVGDRVIVDGLDDGEIRYVRYGWQPYTRANLVNADGLPASTFKGRIRR